MIELWHGGRRWDTSPEIRPPKPRRYECGPGIYLTNQYDRARKYAKGGAVTTKVALKDGIQWLESRRMDVDLMLDYVRNAPGFRHRHQVLDDLKRSAEREDRKDIVACTLLNLCVNHEALSGIQGVKLAEWLACNGIEASLHKVSTSEHWVIVFEPKIITRYQVIPAKDVQLEHRSLPLVQPGA